MEKLIDWKTIAIVMLLLLLINNYQDNNNAVDKYKTKIALLENMKQKEIVKIVEVKKEVEKKIYIVKKYKVPEISTYYQDRYKLDVPVIDNKIVFSDTIAKLNIIELVQKDGLEKEVTHLNNIVVLCENQSKNKDKIIKKEKRKKTFWKIATFISLSILGGLYISK